MTGPSPPPPRSGGRILIDQLALHGTDVIFGVPGESYLAALDALHDSPIRFELWMVHADGHAELVNAFDVESGFVLTNINDQTGDLRYIIHFPAPAVPRDVVVSMTCQRTSGRCTDDMQPGEVCFAGHTCAEGLVCAPGGTACDPIWFGGTCVVPNDDSACAEDGYDPACGCNGVTYANACLATAAGAGTRSSGACPGVKPPS